MSSTREAAERAAAEFHDRVLVPLGRELQRAGDRLADVAPLRTAESFYQNVPAFGKADFDLRVGGDPETLRASLLRQWKDEPRLHPFAEKVAEFSASLGSDLDLSSEVSAFVYVMF